MELEDLGFTKTLRAYCIDHDIDLRGVGRIISEHKGRYIVKTETDEYNAEVIGRIMYEADDRSGFPAVGDWVEITTVGGNVASIRSILPRSSSLERQAVGTYASKQIIATNIDFGLIVQAVDRDLNINRLQRYTTICNSSDIDPIIVLSKADLVSPESLEIITQDIKKRIPNSQIIAVSNESLFGLEELKSTITKGKTYCLLGSSGVGKSSLVNSLAGTQIMDTGEIGTKTNRGKHVTTHRELIVLEKGGIIIDNPGMREVGIGDTGEGLDITFSEITAFASQCRFNDCKHIKEKGCAILEAINEGIIDRASYDNYTRMQRETEHYQSSDHERRQKGKKLAKMIKNVKNNTRQNHNNF